MRRPSSGLPTACRRPLRSGTPTCERSPTQRRLRRTEVEAFANRLESGFRADPRSATIAMAPRSGRRPPGRRPHRALSGTPGRTLAAAPGASDGDERALAPGLASRPRGRPGRRPADADRPDPVGHRAPAELALRGRAVRRRAEAGARHVPRPRTRARHEARAARTCPARRRPRSSGSAMSSYR